MRLTDLLAVMSEYTYIHLVDTNGYLLDRYNGRDSISPEYGEYEVTEVSISNALVPNKYITIEVKEA